MQMTLDGTRRITPLVQSSFTERNGILSPDGHWLAYESNENSSQFEIFVRPYPEVNTGRWQVSTAGGNRPLWARNGQELIYVSPSGALMRVGVVPGPSWVSTPPTLLVKEGYYRVPGQPRSNVRHLGGRTTAADDQGGRRRRDRCACKPHRRAALGRGAESPRADEVTGARQRRPDTTPRVKGVVAKD